MNQSALYRDKSERRRSSAIRRIALSARRENRIKETQLDLFGARTSCQAFISNSFRIVLSALAYTLMQRLKTLALQGTELARASSTTIRVRLLKIGAVVIRNTRRIRLLLASEHPLQHVFEKAALALSG